MDRTELEVLPWNIVSNGPRNDETQVLISTTSYALIKDGWLQKKGLRLKIWTDRFVALNHLQIVYSRKVNILSFFDSRLSNALRLAHMNMFCIFIKTTP